MEYDIAIVGGGIVGLATALALTQMQPRLRLTIVEKEEQVAQHQTGHNSGVIHSGIYYKPGSLKAQLCVQGARRMMAFCEGHGIRTERAGKVIVATDARELPRLDALHTRALANGVAGVRMMPAEELREIEPHAAGIAAIYSPNTAIVDYGEVARAMAKLLGERQVALRTGERVIGIETHQEELVLQTQRNEIAAHYLVNCSGLYSDQIVRMTGADPQVQIVPFRGEYHILRPERQHLVNGLIYPVPDPQFPFLGVHLTRTVHHEVEAGPNAVLAFAREGYTMGRVNLSELGATLRFPGFRTMAKRYWRTGSAEFYRSLSKHAFVEALRRLVPDLDEQDVVRGGAGVRAQALDAQGNLIDDFKLIETRKALHVLNAPSPAATASLAIGDYIATRAMAAYGLTANATILSPKAGIWL
jgi:(S)-2-hydroxyglutarate dehydrogenase